jgi:succinate-semialdehyde dehydrogenase/glutarate-semialdehyde dehydrogenase
MKSRLPIGGERVAGEGAALEVEVEVEYPYTEEAFAHVGAASPEQVDAAVAAAAAAVRSWAATPAGERAELLHEVAACLRARTDELAELMSREGGKPRVENADESSWTAAAFDFYAEIGRNSAGRVIPSIESTQLALVLKEPIGVVAATLGPVAPIVRVGSLDEAIELANASPYEAFQETKHVHLETKVAAKEWWYPYGGTSGDASPPHGA